MNLTKKYKIRNPYRSDELITQEVLIGDDFSYDYSNSPWVAIDTEYLSLDINKDQLCTIQIASPAENLEGMLRVEIIWVWEKNQAVMQKLASLLSRTDLELIFHVGAADLPRLEKFAQQKFNGKVFDTKVAAKIVMTNTSDHGMNDLITGLLDPKFVKDKKVTASQWDISPTSWNDNQFEYAMNDVIYLHALKEALQKIALRRNRSEILAEAMTALPVVAHLIGAGYDEKVFSY